MMRWSDDVEQERGDQQEHGRHDHARRLQLQQLVLQEPCDVCKRRGTAPNAPYGLEQPVDAREDGSLRGAGRQRIATSLKPPSMSNAAARPAGPSRKWRTALESGIKSPGRML